MKKGLIFIVSAAILIGVLLFAGTEESSKSKITGSATTQTTSSDATIQAYFAIALSNNLSAGISFGTIATLPSTNVNATANYNNTNFTLYSVDVSSDSNVNVDFCLKADSAFDTSGGDVIGLGNWTYSDDTANNITNPSLAGEFPINTTYVGTGTTNRAGGNSNYYRFWLDVPAAQAAGVYNNTVTFKGIQTGGAC